MGIINKAWRAWTHADARDELDQRTAERKRLDAEREQHTAKTEEASRKLRDAARRRK